MFRRWRSTRAGAPELLLIGRLAMEFRNEPGVRYLGFVSEAAKFALMARARALLMPSEMESLSLVTLESLAQGAPVIATGRGSVVRDHVSASGGGLLFEDEAGLHNALDALASDDRRRAQLGAAGRAYVLERFSKAAVRARLDAAITAALEAAAP
jgi:glycosyltransferase involved in cell wall biosynthesis